MPEKAVAAIERCLLQRETYIGVVQPLHMQPDMARYKSGARKSACIAPGLKAQLPIKHHDRHGAGTLGPLLILPTLGQRTARIYGTFAITGHSPNSPDLTRRTLVGLSE